MKKRLDVSIHEMPARITVDMDHETYKTFAEACRLLDEGRPPTDHIKELIQNRIDAYERAMASAHERVHAPVEVEGDHG